MESAKKTKEFLERVDELLRVGLNLTQIARRFRKTYSTVYSKIDRAGYRVDPKNDCLVPKDRAVELDNAA